MFDLVSECVYYLHIRNKQLEFDYKNQKSYDENKKKKEKNERLAASDSCNKDLFTLLSKY